MNRTLRALDEKPAKTKLAMAIAAALAVSAAPTQATIVVDDLIGVSGFADVTTPLGAPGDDSDSDLSDTYASMNTFASGASGSADSYAFGRDTGRYFAGAFADGGEGFGGDAIGAGENVAVAAAGAATFSWTRTVFNDSADTSYLIGLDTFLYGGALEMFGEPGLGFASYDWLIQAVTPDGVITILDSEVTIDGNSIVTGGADGGLDEQGDDDGMFYDWQERQLFTDLGILDPNEELQIIYELAVHAEINGGNCDFGDEYYYGGCYASAFTGDPNEFNLDPVPGSQIQVQVVGVPEPVSSSLSLLGLGALGVAAGRRRKRET